MGSLGLLILSLGLVGYFPAVIHCVVFNGTSTRPGWGFYVHPKHDSFLQAALSRNPVTDKVTDHNYNTLYAKYFIFRRERISRLLEIGLGCDMAYGPGASATLWRLYFPSAEIWEAEYDGACVERHKSKLDALNVKTLVGDQSNVDVLKSWVEISGGDFDVIIDDGGHTKAQQFSSFLYLFQHALRPGGIYFIEDLQVARIGYYSGGRVSGIDTILGWMDQLVMKNKGKTRVPFPPGIKTIECAMEICAFIKCYADDPHCSHEVEDLSLLSFGPKSKLPLR